MTGYDNCYFSTLEASELYLTPWGADLQVRYSTITLLEVNSVQVDNIDVPWHFVRTVSVAVSQEDVSGQTGTEWSFVLEAILEGYDEATRAFLNELNGGPVVLSFVDGAGRRWIAGVEDGLEGVLAASSTAEGSTVLTISGGQREQMKKVLESVVV